MGEGVGCSSICHWVGSELWNSQRETTTIDLKPRVTRTHAGRDGSQIILRLLLSQNILESLMLLGGVVDCKYRQRADGEGAVQVAVGEHVQLANTIFKLAQYHTGQFDIPPYVAGVDLDGAEAVWWRHGHQQRVAVRQLVHIGAHDELAACHRPHPTVAENTNRRILVDH